MLRFLLFPVLICLSPIIARGQRAAAPGIDLRKPVPLPQKEVLHWPGPGIATSHLGFFCRQEIKADKKLAMPVRLRMGSMQQNDWLESKPNAIRPEK